MRQQNQTFNRKPMFSEEKKTTEIMKFNSRIFRFVFAFSSFDLNAHPLLCTNHFSHQILVNLIARQAQERY